MSSDSIRPLRTYVSLQRGTTYKGALVGLPGPVLLGLASIEPNGGFRAGGFKTYGGECPDKISLHPGDIYVSLKDVTQSGDLLGSVARVPVGIKSGRLTQDTVKLVFEGDPINKDYLYWLLRTPEYRSFCRGRATGTTTLGLGRDDFLDFPVPEPSPAHELLVEVLEGVEKRIVLLHETNATLEAIAQALFKSWFVDFDPVRAKQQGLAPEGMDEATAELFPDVMDVGQQGAFPMGWRQGTLGDVLAEESSRIGKREAIVLSAVQTGQLVRSDEHFNKRVHSENIEKYKAVSPFSFAYNPSRINIGSIGLNEFDCLGAVSPVYVVARPSVGAAYLVWHYLRTENAKQRIKALATGTVRQSLSFNDFASIPLTIPSGRLLDAFIEVRAPLYEQVRANSALAETLASLRDSLLPRLISGQLRLPETDQLESDALLEEVAA